MDGDGEEDEDGEVMDFDRKTWAEDKLRIYEFMKSHPDFQLPHEWMKVLEVSELPGGDLSEKIVQAYEGFTKRSTIRRKLKSDDVFDILFGLKPAMERIWEYEFSMPEITVLSVSKYVAEYNRLAGEILKKAKGMVFSDVVFPLALFPMQKRIIIPDSFSHADHKDVGISYELKGKTLYVKNIERQTVQGSYWNMDHLQAELTAALSDWICREVRLETGDAFSDIYREAGLYSYEDTLYSIVWPLAIAVQEELGEKHPFHSIHAVVTKLNNLWDIPLVLNSYEGLRNLNGHNLEGRLSKSRLALLDGLGWAVEGEEPTFNYDHPSADVRKRIFISVLDSDRGGPIN